MNLNKISWIKKTENMSQDAIKTPNRLDDSVFSRSRQVKALSEQKNIGAKINISDSLFNKIPGYEPGKTLKYNKARLKLYGPKLIKIDKYIGDPTGLKHI